MRISSLVALHFVTLSISCASLHAQTPTWLKHYGSGWIEGLYLIEDGNGGFYGTGTSGSDISFDGQETGVLGAQDIFLGRWDGDGNAVWARTAGGECGPASEFDWGTRIVFDADQAKVIIAGTYDCPSTFFGDHMIVGSASDQADMFLAAYDNTGECLWANGVRGELSAMELLIDDVSDIYIVGANGNTVSFPGPTSVPPGGFIAKYGPDGIFINAQRALKNGILRAAGWVGTNEWVLTGMIEDGAQLFGVDIEVESPVSDGFVARAGTDGSVDWITTFRSSNAVEVWDCATNLSGRINVAGYFIDSLFLANDTLLGAEGVWSFFLGSLSNTGEVQWITAVSSVTQALVHDLKIAPDGDIYVQGHFIGPLTLGTKVLQPPSSINGFVARFGPSGECLAALGFGRVGYGIGSVIPTNDGIIVSCDYDSAMVVGTGGVPITETDIRDVFIAKFDSLSGFTGVQSLALEGDNTLHIYANPSNGLCTVDLPDAIAPGSSLVLSIYDTHGRLVQQVPLTIQGGTVQLDIQAQAKGIYHVELQDGAKRYTGQIVFE